MYGDGMPHVGVLAPCAQLGFQSSADRRWRLGFHVVVCLACVNRAPNPAPYIYRER
jgi:hypothetical protein